MMLCWRFQALYNIGSHLPFYQVHISQCFLVTIYKVLSDESYRYCRRGLVCWRRPCRSRRVVARCPSRADSGRRRRSAAEVGRPATGSGCRGCCRWCSQQPGSTPSWWERQSATATDYTVSVMTVAEAGRGDDDDGGGDCVVVASTAWPSLLPCYAQSCTDTEPPQRSVTSSINSFNNQIFLISYVISKL